MFYLALLVIVLVTLTGLLRRKYLKIFAIGSLFVSILVGTMVLPATAARGLIDRARIDAFADGVRSLGAQLDPINVCVLAAAAGLALLALIPRGK